MASVRAADLAPGTTRELVLVDDLTRTQIVQYAGASGDFNPLHTDEVFAREVAGFPGVFAHGMLTMGMTGRVLTEWFGVERLTRFGVRFVKPVWPGDTLTATATVDAVRDDGGVVFADISIVTVNQDGEAVVKGSATARLDP
jgi:acyl dehydratase